MLDDAAIGDPEPAVVAGSGIRGAHRVPHGHLYEPAILARLGRRAPPAESGGPARGVVAFVDRDERIRQALLVAEIHPHPQTQATVLATEKVAARGYCPTPD